MVGLLWVHISGCFRDVLVLSETPMRTFYLMPSPGDLCEPYPSSLAGCPPVVLGSVLSGGAQLPSERSLSPPGKFTHPKFTAKVVPALPILAAAGNLLWLLQVRGGLPGTPCGPETALGWPLSSTLPGAGSHFLSFLSYSLLVVGKGGCWAHLSSNFCQRDYLPCPSASLAFSEMGCCRLVWLLRSKSCEDRNWGVYCAC